MRIGVDFDRVLFDTDSFDQELKKKVDGLEHVEDPPYDENGNYDPEMHAEILGISTDEIYETVQGIASEFLFDDVDRLDGLDCKVMIVSRGNQQFQSMKIEHSGALEFVDGYEIVEAGSKEKANIDLLVDDREAELERVKIPTMLFDRDRHGVKDIVEWVKSRET